MRKVYSRLVGLLLDVYLYHRCGYDSFRLALRLAKEYQLGSNKEGDKAAGAAGAEGGEEGADGYNDLPQRLRELLDMVRSWKRDCRKEFDEFIQLVQVEWLQYLL